MTCAAEPSDSTKTETSRKNIISRIIEYFSESNRSYPTKKFDFSIIGGPHYSSDSKFGIGILGAGLYRSSANDTLTPVSQVSIYTDLTTAAHFKVGICGTHIFPGDAKRLTYDVSLSSISTRFWGIGYDECRDEVKESVIRPQDIKANGYLTFTSEFTPLTDVTVNILRVEVNGSGNTP